MTSKELRRLSRRDLLELLVQQKEQNEELKTKTSKLEARLASRTIEIDNAGSMAEAALVLSKVFEAADESVAMYKENIQRCSEEQEKAYKAIVLAAEQKASEIIRAAEEVRDREIEKAKADRRRILQQLGNLLRAHPEIKDWIASSMQENE